MFFHVLIRGMTFSIFICLGNVIMLRHLLLILVKGLLGKVIFLLLRSSQSLNVLVVFLLTKSIIVMEYTNIE